MHGAAGRLRWKGIDVTDEFRQYAERVAQGEDLPPYAGQILAAPHPSFPWEPEAQRKALRRARGVQVALWCTALTIAGLIAWSVAVKYSAQQLTASTPMVQPSQRDLVPAERGLAAPKPVPVPVPVPELESELESPGSEATLAPASAVELGSEAARTAPNPVAPASFTAALGQPAPAPRANPYQTPKRPATSSAPSTTVSTMTPAPNNVAPPGSLRDALGALLAARGAPSELPPSAPTSPVQSGTADVAAASVESTNAGPVGKEPGGTASGKGSMLVETPSF